MAALLFAVLASCQRRSGEPLTKPSTLLASAAMASPGSISADSMTKEKATSSESSESSGGGPKLAAPQRTRS